MTSSPIPITPDPRLDLVLEREIDVPVEAVWEAWTTPSSLREWFVPKPWTIAACEMDVRPGGLFSTTMRSPEGEEFPNVGCFLEVVEGRRLVFTDTLLPGYRPSAKPFFTAVLELAPMGEGTLYRAIAIHGSEETRGNHEQMGFHEGWGIVVDQMAAHIKAQAGA
jgi:uncharacterized protein YndB with AHSA1/START domain